MIWPNIGKWKYSLSSDLDETTKEQLQYGKGLMELLKQPLYHPLSLHDQVISLCAATNKVLLPIKIEKIKEFQMGMLSYFNTRYPEIGNEIEEKKTLSDELVDRIVKAAVEYRDGSQI